MNTLKITIAVMLFGVALVMACPSKLSAQVYYSYDCPPQGIKYNYPVAIGITRSIWCFYPPPRAVYRPYYPRRYYGYYGPVYWYPRRYTGLWVQQPYSRR